MNFTDAENAIIKFFDTAWASATPIAWPDDLFEPPDSTWVRFTCQETSGNQASMGSPGSNRFRHFGIVTIQVFSKEGQSSEDAKAKATSALSAFMGAETQGIKFYESFARQIGNDGKGWYQINVTAMFRYDEIT